MGRLNLLKLTTEGSGMPQLGYQVAGENYASAAVSIVNPYSQRNQLFVPAQAGANAVVQLSATSLPFREAYFYGVKAANATGAPTWNAASVWLGEKDAEGNLYFTDEILNTPASAMEVGPGGFNFEDFWVLLPTIGDRLLVKYQV